jgi:hypothetical protein
LPLAGTLVDGGAVADAVADAGVDSISGFGFSGSTGRRFSSVDLPTIVEGGSSSLACRTAGGGIRLASE